MLWAISLLATVSAIESSLKNQFNRFAVADEAANSEKKQ